ncbi:vimentin [Striga asiatica]|uniref:Vimentin n=1 Tax=Striga asiatica TaxID=4170 RepID=A0A5A7PX59_STRAF|nr:vimentin [Striga asiatica]
MAATTKGGEELEGGDGSIERERRELGSSIGVRTRGGEDELARLRSNRSGLCRVDLPGDGLKGCVRTRARPAGLGSTAWTATRATTDGGLGGQLGLRTCGPRWCDGVARGWFTGGSGSRRRWLAGKMGTWPDFGCEGLMDLLLSV